MVQWTGGMITANSRHSYEGDSWTWNFDHQIIFPNKALSIYCTFNESSAGMLTSQYINSIRLTRDYFKLRISLVDKVNGKTIIDYMDQTEGRGYMFSESSIGY